MNNSASKKIDKSLQERYFEKLPDYSSGSMSGDLIILESLFIKNGISPIYSEITRKDLDIPVFRTIIPGFEISGDFDEYYRVSKRQFENLKSAFNKQD